MTKSAQKYAVALGRHPIVTALCIAVLFWVPVSVAGYSLTSQHPKAPAPHVVKEAAKPKPEPVKAVVVAPKPTPAPTPPPKPTPAPAPRPAPVRIATPPPVKVTPPAASPAAVAAVSASPGTGANTLTPSPPSGSSGSSGPGGSSGSGSGSTQPTSYTSQNWAGYIATGSTYTTVSGSWTIPPAPTGNGTSTSADASWIGIGGLNGSDLIQVGSEDAIDASGTVSSAIFYELLPASPVYPTTVTVSPGDVIAASLSEISSGQWQITITDTTTGKTFTTTVSYTSSHSSAEWIEEDPTYTNGTAVPLDHFGTIDFTGAQTTMNGTLTSLKLSKAVTVTMITSSGVTMATPSAIGADGQSFSVTRSAN